MRVLARKLLVYTHRWLGIALGALFVGWFVSGVVMMYARMPRLTPAERLARLPDLDPARLRVDPATLTDGTAAVTSLRLTTWLGRPVYRITADGRTRSVLADTGDPLPPIGADEAVAAAQHFAPAHAGTARYAGRLDRPDQWTLEIARQLPMHRVTLGDPDGTDLYVSAATGDVVLDAPARERRWAHPGAILHWIYLTPFRRHGYAWGQFIIWSSVAGTLMCAVGLVWGVWRLSPSRRFRLKRQRSMTPYAGWMRWHHYIGLAAGTVTLTWIFSGLLSMSPWDWHPSTAPTAAQRQAFSGGPMTVDGLTAAAIARALAQMPGARDAELLQFRGQRYLAGDHRLVALDPGASTPLDRGALLAAAAAAGGGARLADASWLDRYDAYYYDRDGELMLPVLRVQYDDAPRTWLYVSATRGTVLRKEERLTRLNRWLYHGLHSLDFPFLYYRRPLWDIVVIVLSLGGLALTLTTLMPALHRLRRLARRVGR